MNEDSISSYVEGLVLKYGFLYIQMLFAIIHLFAFL